jgi:hypothetical protein
MRVTLELASGAYTVQTKEPQTGVVIDALDHHGAVTGSVTLDTGPKPKSGRIKGKDIASVRVRAGDYSATGTTSFAMDESVSIDTMR